jgi:signal transduction histidine kinase/Tfp pilus assembly protein PilF
MFFGNLYAITAQTAFKLDSLDRAINSRSGIENYPALIMKMRILFDTDYGKALKAAEQAYAVASDAGDSAKVVESARMCGQLYNYLNRSNEAIAILSSVRTAAEGKYPVEYVKILNNLAIAHTARAEYDKAIDLHFRVLALDEEMNDDASRELTLTNIGHAYFRMRNFNEALTHFKKALDIERNEEDNYSLGLILTNIGMCYNQMNQFDDAKEYFLRALDECEEGCRPEIHVMAQHGLGIVEFELGNIGDAREYFAGSYAHAVTGRHNRLVAENLFWLAKVKIAEGNDAGASKDLLEVERLARNQNYTELLISAYKQLSVVYDKQQDYKLYSMYLEKYVSLKDSIYDEHVLNKLARAKADYEQRENLAIIKAKEMTIAQQHRFNMAVMIIAFLAGALVIVLYYNNKSMKKINVELSTAKDLIYDQNKELEIRNRELDRLVERKTDELKLVNLSLKEMNDELNTFIYRTAQDIRGPLATLKGMCYVALMDIRDEASLTYLNKINSTTENLQTILKRLLIINSINSTKINPQVIDLKGLVDNAISSQQRKGLPKNLLFRKNIAENVIIQCDQELLSIVLENSIENAVKFCNNSWGTEHFVEVHVAPGKNNRVNIRVVHNGIVTSEYNTDDIYEVFLDSMFAEPGEHSGQDLYFVKTAAKKMGAKVEMRKTSEGFNELTVVL